MLTLVSNCIDRLNVYNSAAHFGECAGSEAGAAWKDILNLLYELLGKELVYHTHICLLRSLWETLHRLNLTLTTDPKTSFFHKLSPINRSLV